MKTAKLGAIFLVSVMALASTGAAYALWSDDLYIDGYVETGYIGAEWSIEDWGDTEPPEKDCSGIIPTLSTWYNLNDYLSIYIYNAYPCITYWVDFDITNTGTIPIHVQDIYWDGNDILEYGVGTFTVTWDGGITFPVQIHPGQSIYGTIKIHLNNNAQQDWDYWFYGELIYHQWNEQPT